MPSGADSLQKHSKYASINHGTLHYGASRSRGRHMTAETWSVQNGIDLDRLLQDEHAFISQMRVGKTSHTVKSREQRVYETLVDLYVDGMTPSTGNAARRLHMSQTTVQKTAEKLRTQGLLVNAATRRGGFLQTGLKPEWKETS